MIRKGEREKGRKGEREMIPKYLKVRKGTLSPLYLRSRANPRIRLYSSQLELSI
jgi:hypothetical protein